MTAERDSTKDRLIEATLRHVPFDGWTRAALNAAAKDAGVAAAVAADLFPKPAELVEHYCDWADHRMVAALAAHNLAALRTREKIALAIRLRLEQNAGDREAVRRALALLALPTNAPLALRRLYRTVDAIWRAAGDTATDFNFYTKRMLLAGVYSATVLYWLEDHSPGGADTLAFLERRLAEVLRIPKALGRLGDIGKMVPDPRNLARAARNAAQRFRDGLGARG